MRHTINLWKALNWPNRISLVRLMLVGPFIVLLLNQQSWAWARHLALAIFVVMAFSDVLDGVLARRLDLKTRLGAILDPLADKTLIISSVFLLSSASLAEAGAEKLVLPNWVVVAVVGKDLWVVIGVVVVYLVTDRLRVTPTRAGKLSTAGQCVLVGWALLAADVERLVPHAGWWGVQATSAAVAALSIWAIISYTRLGLSFAAVEAKPLEDGGGNKHDRIP
jgi:cardiolipin synthase